MLPSFGSVNLGNASGLFSINCPGSGGLEITIG